MVQNIKQWEGSGNRGILVGCLSLIAVALVVFALTGKRFFVVNGPTPQQKLETDKHPIPEWIIKDAIQCKGDFSRLPMDEQQRIQAVYPGQSAWVIVSAAYSSKR